MKKIVFIVNSIQIQRIVKRINSFYDTGHDIEVYAFDRDDVSPCGLMPHFDYKIIGHFPNNMPYIKRLSYMRKSLRGVLTEIKKDNCILYIFGLDAAIVTRSVIKLPYFYEEADLVHTYISNSSVVKLLEWLDVRIIKKSLLTILTSDGFVDYHFGKKNPPNVMVIGNKLNPAILNLSKIEKPILDINHLKIGFVGSFRFQSVLNFCRVLVENFPQHELHVFGSMPENSQVVGMKKLKNFHFHGYFKNPEDLPLIYSQIDLSLSTYDANTINAQYAEPNKMYEAVYFDTPIIVSKNTFLERKVNRLKIGFSIDALNDAEIISFISSLSEDSINNCISNLKLIDKFSAINQPDSLFKVIDTYM